MRSWLALKDAGIRLRSPGRGNQSSGWTSSRKTQEIRSLLSVELVESMAPYHRKNRNPFDWAFLLRDHGGGSGQRGQEQVDTGREQPYSYYEARCSTIRTQTRNMPGGRLAVRAYSPYPGAPWEQFWCEAKRGEWASAPPSIVRALELAAPTIADLVEKAWKKREEDQRRWEAECKARKRRSYCSAGGSKDQRDQAAREGIPKEPGGIDEYCQRMGKGEKG